MDLSRVRWFKSSRSGTATDCVEVAFAGAEVGVRDSKSPEGPALVLGSAAWRVFAAGVRAGGYELR